MLVKRTIARGQEQKGSVKTRTLMTDNVAMTIDHDASLDVDLPPYFPPTRHGNWAMTPVKEHIKWMDNNFMSSSVTMITALYKVNPEPRKWVFGSIMCQADDTSEDNDLTRMLQDANVKAANAYRAQGTPAAQHTIQIMDVEQGCL
ncbi:hypothetical protein ARMGADRAFT_1089224 [Armillaria gallica]|uniref:Uncharacterized protein n=1 Tax=Armillaria gallica TaxID=47427 RepID=A0A2H3CP16_ARMGA|nr:hypothetical protein ARMGADRAFT_1089224 [Armillaria gallica]